MIYVLDAARREEILDRARRALADVPDVAGVIGTEQFAKYGVANPKDDPHAPDLIAFAAEGTSFGKTTAGDALWKEKTERSGSHGHDHNLPHLHAIFVASGNGIAKGVTLETISNTSVAPTIARLLNFDLPNPEGPVLSAALAQ